MIEDTHLKKSITYLGEHIPVSSIYVYAHFIWELKTKPSQNFLEWRQIISAIPVTLSTPLPAISVSL